MPTDTDQLVGIPFFQLLDERERAGLAATVDVVRIPAGQVIFHYGDPGDSLYVIRAGEVEIFVQDDTGVRIVLETAREGDYFGEISLLDGKPRSATIRSDTVVRTLSLPAWNFGPLLDAHPSMARKLLLGLCQHLRAMESPAG